MPIYEYYCKPCNTIFNFYARTFSVSKEPRCPRCSGGLQKYVSRFSLGHKLKGPEHLPLKPQRLAEGMQRLKTLEDQDPPEAARLRRRFGEMTGVTFEEQKKKPYGTRQDSPDSGGDHKTQGAEPERDPTLYEL